MSKIVVLAQVVIAMSVIVGYIILTILNKDATPLLTLLAGQGVGAVVQAQGQGDKGLP